MWSVSVTLFLYISLGDPSGPLAVYIIYTCLWLSTATSSLNFGLDYPPAILISPLRCPRELSNFTLMKWSPWFLSSNPGHLTQPLTSEQIAPPATQEPQNKNLRVIFLYYLITILSWPVCLLASKTPQVCLFLSTSSFLTQVKTTFTSSLGDRMAF